MRCAACPFDVDTPCQGETKVRPHLCEWAASPHAAHRMMVRDLNAMPAPVAGPPPTLPPLRTQAGNALAAAARAAARAASAAVSGEPLTVSPETLAARLAVCGGCDQRTEGGRCAGCGCWIAAKARLTTEECPLGKWPGPKDTP